MVVERLARVMPPDPTGEFPFEVHEYFIQAVHRMARVRDAQIEVALAPLGLNVSRYRALVAVIRAGQCTMNDLATLVAYDRTTMARVVHQLVTAGLLRRLPIKGDRRAVGLSVTEHGEAVYRQTVEPAARLNQQLFEGLREEQLRRLMRVLEPMLSNIGSAPADVAGSLSRHWN